MKRLPVLLLSLLVAASLFATGGTERSSTQRVVAYTAHEDTIISEMTARFTSETGMEIEFIKLGSSEVIQRVVAEAGNPQADVIWSIGGEALEANASVLEPYTPREWDKIADVFKVGTNWLPYTGIMNVFIVNTQMVPENLMPRTWSDLQDGTGRTMRTFWKPRLRSSSPSGKRLRNDFGFWSLIAIGGYLIVALMLPDVMSGGQSRRFR